MNIQVPKQMISPITGNVLKLDLNDIGDVWIVEHSETVDEPIEKVVGVYTDGKESFWFCLTVPASTKNV